MDKDNEKEKELSRLIKDTLAGYEEEYVAGAWENFAAKQKYILKKEQNRRKRVIHMRYAATLAACLLLGIILLNIYEKKQPAGTPSIGVVTDVSKTSPSETKSLKPTSPGIYPGNRLAENNNTGISEQNPTKKVTPNNIETTVKPDITDLQKSVKTEAQQPANQEAQRPANQEAQQPANQQTATQRPPTNTLAPTPIQTERQSERSGSARKVRFGINVAPGINSTTTSTAYNYSGGINVDIPLSKTLALSTGMQVENQTVESKSTISNTAIPSDNRRASLINLDFPLNIKWKFLSRKSGSYYIAGGISSLAYLSEKYTTTSRKQELREVVALLGNEETKTYKLENVETTTTHSTGASNKFDIAGRLNISIGFEKQISPSLYLHIEPFMKIPVSGLAAENLIFTTSGITFKISF